MSPDTNTAPPSPPLPEAPPPAPAAPAPAAPPVMRRSPGAALFFSFLPGLGHVYLGLYARAAVIFLAFFTAVTLADHNGSLGLVAAFLWFFGLIDAYRQAQLINLGERDVSPAAAASRGSGSLGLGVFLTGVGTILLVDRFYPIDLSWLADWWPALLVLAGLYFIVAALRERRQASRWSPDDDAGLGESGFE